MLLGVKVGGELGNVEGGLGSDGVSNGAGCKAVLLAVGKEFIGAERSAVLFPNGEGLPKGEALGMGVDDENPLDAELLNISKPFAEPAPPLEGMGAGPETSGML